MTLTELYRKAFDVNGEVTQTIVGVEELSFRKSFASIIGASTTLTRLRKKLPMR